MEILLSFFTNGKGRHEDHQGNQWKPRDAFHRADGELHEMVKTFLEQIQYGGKLWVVLQEVNF